MKISRNKILSVLLLVENCLILFLFFLFIFQLKNINSQYFQYGKVFQNYFYFHPWYFLLSLLLAILLMIFHIILWHFIFNFLKIKKNLLTSTLTYFKIHTKRLFSPFGPISPFINLEAENRFQSISYIFYSYVVFIGSFLFFGLIFIFFENILFFSIAVLLITLSFLLKNRFLKYIKGSQFLFLILIAFIIEALSFSIFYLTNLIFLENINIYDSFIAYLIWVIVSSIFPILYGTGASEALSLIYIYYLGYNHYLFLLSLVYYRLLTTYLPILGMSMKYLKIYSKSIDK